MSGSGPKRPSAGRGPGRAGQRPRTSGAAPTQRADGEAPWSPRRPSEEFAAPSEGAAGRKLSAPVAAQPDDASREQVPTDTSKGPFVHYRLAEEAYRYVTGQTVAAPSGAFAAAVTLTLTAASVLLFVVACVTLYGLWVSGQQGPGEGSLAQAEAVQRRVIDESKLMNQRRAGKAAAAAKPQAAPVTINVPSDVYFHELEVRCEETDFRSRGRFYGGRATVLSVPPETLCWARLMGSEQARWPVYAGQTFACTFGPTKCVER